MRIEDRKKRDYKKNLVVLVVISLLIGFMTFSVVTFDKNISKEYSKLYDKQYLENNEIFEKNSIFQNGETLDEFKYNLNRKNVDEINKIKANIKDKISISKIEIDLETDKIIVDEFYTLISKEQDDVSFTIKTDKITQEEFDYLYTLNEGEKIVTKVKKIEMKPLGNKNIVKYQINIVVDVIDKYNYMAVEEFEHLFWEIAKKYIYMFGIFLSVIAWIIYYKKVRKYRKTL